MRLYKRPLERRYGESAPYELATDAEVLRYAAEVLRARASVVFQEGRATMETVLRTAADVCEREAAAKGEKG